MKINKQNQDITFYVNYSFLTTNKHAINQSINQTDMHVTVWFYPVRGKC
jgi:hypothetical protein